MAQQWMKVWYHRNMHEEWNDIIASKHQTRPKLLILREKTCIYPRTCLPPTNTCNVYEKTLRTLGVNLQFVVFNHLQPKTMNELKKKRLSGIISKTQKKIQINLWFKTWSRYGSRQVQANSLASCLGMLIGFFQFLFDFQLLLQYTHTQKRNPCPLYLQPYYRTPSNSLSPSGNE